MGVCRVTPPSHPPQGRSSDRLPCYRSMDQLHQIQQGAEAATITNDMAEEPTRASSAGPWS